MKCFISSCHHLYYEKTLGCAYSQITKALSNKLNRQKLGILILLICLITHCQIVITFMFVALM